MRKRFLASARALLQCGCLALCSRRRILVLFFSPSLPSDTPETPPTVLIPGLFVSICLLLCICIHASFSVCIGAYMRLLRTLVYILV